MMLIHGLFAITMVVGAGSGPLGLLGALGQKDGIRALVESYTPPQQKAEGALLAAVLLHAMGYPERIVLGRLLVPWYTVPLSQTSRDAASLMRQWYGTSPDRVAGCSEWLRRLLRLQAMNLHARVYREGMARRAFFRSHCSRRQRCELEYRIGRSAFYVRRGRREARRTYRLLKRTLALCSSHPDANVRVKTAYLAGRAAARAGLRREAISMFRWVVVHHPSHSYVDDAMVRMAALYEAEGKGKEARRWLWKAVRFGGDMAYRAAWLMVRDSLMAHRWREAISSFPKIMASLPRGRGERWARLVYWHGRALEMAGRGAGAKKWYSRAMREAPGTFYAFLARQRLDAAFRGAGTELIRSLMNESVTPPPMAGMMEVVRFASSLPPSTWDYVVRRLATSRVVKADPRLWRGVARLLHAMGMHSLSYRIVGRILADQRAGWPSEGLRAVWEMAYPRAFEPIVVAESAAAGVPSTFVWGLMREESGYSPTARSWAGALGLCQLMPATARHTAKKWKLAPPREEDLLDPATNVRIATRHMKDLWDEFGGNPVLVSAAYNAGRGAVRRWLRSFGSLPVDEFVERIPYRETRGYVRRVVSSYAVYTLLYEGTLLEIPLEIKGPR